MKLPVVHFETNAEPEPLIILQRGKVFSTTVWMKEARVAQVGWAAKPLKHRLKWVQRVRQALAENGMRLAELEAKQTGRPVEEILSSQLIPLCDACCFLEHSAEKILRPKKFGRAGRPFWLMGHQAKVHREPLGLVLVIAPSNYRVFLPGVMILQALVAGNAVFLKPGEGGARIAEELRLIFEREGLDTRLFRVLPETAEAARETISLQVDKIVFTGSAETGQKILQQAAKHLTPTTMELSGCDAVFVREDADLDLVIRALLFGLRLNNSETCIAPRRLFVAQSRSAELQTKLFEALSQAGPTYCSRNDEVYRLVQQASQWGATFLFGGIRPNGELIFPMVLTGAHPSMRLLRTDLFAPVLSMVTVMDDEEAIGVCHECPFALGASIFSADKQAAQNLAKKLNVGCVVINDIIVPTADPRLPFGGRKQSGFGVTRGAEGLLEMTVPKVITVRRSRIHPHLESPTDNDAAFLNNYLVAAHSGNFGSRLRSWGQLGKLLLQRRNTKKAYDQATN